MVFMSMDPAQKVILITGASRGIGFATARMLASRGINVVIGSRDPVRAKASAMEAGCGWVRMDISEQDSVLAAVTALKERLGRLDVLINNAAVLLDHYENLVDLKPEILRETLETNVIGTLRVTQAFLPMLQASSDPRIINISSGAGQLDGEPQAWAPAYSISKTALNMLTQQLTGALPDVMVNSMCPGWCRTAMGGEDAPRTPEEGADTAVWLALEAPNSLRGKFFKNRAVIPW